MHSQADRPGQPQPHGGSATVRAKTAPAARAPRARSRHSAWADDDTLTTDPQREISLVHYPSRAGLEDRVFRIRTDCCSATSRPGPGRGTT
ncbi:aromatic-ring-hydroxylating dioxygenase subunit beta [Streptomyces sp. NBC_01006]|uniref:aromatic-ring-hydroxylating dioxygenase subunit beta n=1 Tax=Streptomyces sp. NBC_01006 TaxID=2903716 RepID=UPI0038697960|nr:hypothetical protein OG509_01600 [Streptomyces sp. NBC_01006]